MAGQFKRVMVPVDFSESTEKILEYAEIFGKKFDAELELVHVVESAPYDIYGAHNIGVPLHDSDGFVEPPEGKYLLQDAKEKAHQKLALLLGEGGKVKISVRTGRIVEELLDEAEAFHADLIVMGTHGWTGLRHLVLGSIAEKMVRLSPVPVLTWRNTKN